MKKYSYIIMALLCLFCLTGCGRQAAEEVQGNQPIADWQKNGFAVSDEVVEEQALWVDSYIPWEHEGVTWNEETEYASDFIQAVCHGEKIYRLLPIISNEQFVFNKCFMEIYDTSSMESSVIELDLEKMGIKKTGETRKLLRSMDVLKDQSYAFHVLDLEVFTDENGSETYNQLFNGLTYLDSYEKSGQVDWFPFFENQGWLELGETIDIFWYCDGVGNSYIRTGSASNPLKQLYILDPVGKIVMDYKVSDLEQIYAPIKTAEGELIFPVWSNENRGTSLVWFDVTKKQAYTLAVLEGEYVKQLYGMQDNDLYYENGFGIVKWNVASGIRKQVFRFDQNGVSDSFGTMLVLREGRTPVLRLWGTMDDETKDWLVTLSEEPVERSDAIRVVSLTEESQRVRNSVPAVSRSNQNNMFVYEDRDTTDAEDYRNRIMAELAAGGGPEIMYVSLEDMEILYERGMLADLRDYISEKTLEKVLPGVLEMGTVDGTLVGMAPGIKATSLRVGESVWSGDSWTLNDILELMESGKLENKIYYNATGTFYGSLAVIRWLAFDNMEDSFLIDWENGESHFEDERFIQLLECVGKYDSSPYEGPWDERMGGGGSLIVFDQIVDFYDAVGYAGTHGAQGSHYVGFPSERGNGNYMHAGGVIVVNKNVSDPEAVSVYLECLLGSEVQMTDYREVHYGLPVIPLPTDNIGYDKETEEYFWKGRRLTVFEDGTNSIQELNAFLEQCVPAPRTYEDLNDIVYEELMAYFSGDKSAEEVAKIIDNRVQLYLDEKN